MAVFQRIFFTELIHNHGLVSYLLIKEPNIDVVPELRVFSTRTPLCNPWDLRKGDATPLRGDGVGSCSSESLEKMYSEL